MGQDASDDPWSVTEKELREQLRTLRRDGTDAAVVTVASVEGSAYRRPGAKMLVPAGGASVGAVTAGCLEDPVVDVATDVIEAGTPRLEVFDLLDDDSRSRVEDEDGANPRLDVVGHLVGHAVGHVRDFGSVVGPDLEHG
jgi:xanthine/CO dehydrogenase XdhC/CoxF family maturation factor